MPINASSQAEPASQPHGRDSNSTLPFQLSEVDSIGGIGMRMAQNPSWPIRLQIHFLPYTSFKFLSFNYPIPIKI